MPYPEMMVRPMREDLVRAGFTELRTADDVDAAMDEAKAGTTLLVVNSVCGCAAGMARPGVALALDRAARPDRLVTVFAGQDVEATARARSFLEGVPPSSPSVALLRDGELVWFLPRHGIEGFSAEQVAERVAAALDEHAGAAA